MNHLIIKLIIWIILIIIIGFLIGCFFLCKKFAKNNTPIIIYSIVVFLIISIILIFSICFCKQAREELKKPKDPILHENLYNLMEYFDKFCQKHDIKYWAVAGTALGMIRNKGIIPHDDDIDVGILEEEVNKIEKLKTEIENNGYTFECGDKSKPDIIKFFKFDNKKVLKDYWIDIFIFKTSEENNDKYVYKNKDHQELWPTEWFYKKELFPLHRFPFDKLKINGPNKPNNYLDRAYPEWHKIRIDLPHGNKTITDYLKVLYNRLDLLP